jgi:CheY-like chemotaxis protein
MSGGLFDAMNVLLVDDDPLSLDMLSEALAAGDRHILTAGSGEDAWEILGRTEVHVVVSDMRMPGMDGLELCRRVRAMKSGTYTYFILITGTPMDPEAYEAAGLAEVDDFVSKPDLAEPLRLRLRAAKRLLNVANRLRELESIIPICAHCRRLRDEEDSYQQMEAYFEKHHSGFVFSHGICPDCLAKHYGEGS